MAGKGPKRPRIVWRYRWNLGEPTPVHFHDKDVVVVYSGPAIDRAERQKLSWMNTRPAKSGSTGATVRTPNSSFEIRQVPLSPSWS